MKRPLGFVALLYGGGLVLAEFFQPSPVLLFSFSFILVAGALLFSRARPILLGALLVFTGWTHLVCRTAIFSPHDLRTLLADVPADVSVRGTLCDTPVTRNYLRDEKESSRTQAQLRVTALRCGANWQSACGRIAVATPGRLPERFFGGQEIVVSGVIAPPPPPLAEGLFDYRTYLRRQGVYYQLKTETTNDWRVVEPAKTRPPLSDRFTAWAHAVLARGLPVKDESLRLEWALTLGDKTVLAEDVAEPFVRAATYHIFAVDGLRMAIVFGIFFTLFRVARLPRAVCGMLLVPLIWFYVALTGWPASAIRATVMLTIIIAGWSLKRPSDLLNSLFAAALAILIWDPQQLFQAGFQLSFFVVLCIVLLAPKFDEFSRRLLAGDPLLPDALRPRWQRRLETPARFILDLIFSSLAAWIGSIPLVAYYFHIVTPVSVPANVLAVPLCALVLAANLIGLLLAGWFAAGAELFNHAGWFLMECIRVTSDWFAGWPLAYYYVAAPGLFGMGLYYLILSGVFTGWLFQPKGRVWKCSGVAMLLLIWFGDFLHARSAARLTVLPLNGGSAVFCDAGKTSLLIDCGNENSVGFITKPFLRAQGVNRLSCLALTHGDDRHIGGGESLSALLPVTQIAASSARFRSPAYRRILDSLRETPGRGLVLRCGDHLGNWTVLHPASDNSLVQADDNALVLRGDFGGTRILLLSDLGRAGQAALLERAADLRADVVVACLPEQSEPAGDALLDAICPKLLIVADSELPATKRAGEALRERLARRGIPVIYTRTAGAVTIAIRKEQWIARAMNGQTHQGRQADAEVRQGSGRTSYTSP